MTSLAEFQVYAVLPCSDYERAKAWYEDKLGLVPSEETGPNGWLRMADGTWFILTQSSNAGTAKNTAAGFTVYEIESVMAGLRDRGVVFEDYPEMGTVDGLLSMGPYKAAWFKDGEGNVVEISQVG